jgi:hypothetical protein
MANFPPVSDLLDLRAVNAAFTLGQPCAEVRVGEHAIRYVRRGSGPCLLLLDADAEANAAWGPIADSLASGYRVVVPETPPDSVDTSAWLRGFVEGLGITSCVVIAGPAMFDAAQDLTAGDDLTVRKLVLIASADTRVGNSTSRILWIEADGRVDDALRRIEAFIATARSG